MFRWAVPLLAGLLTALVSCAPTASQVNAGPSLVVSSFSRGVAWAYGRNVYVLQGPRYELEKVTLPAPVSGLAWWNQDLYASLPASNWVLRVQGVSDIRPLGRARALSANLVYLDTGDILTPAGVVTSYRVPGIIRSVTSVDQTDFVLSDTRLWKLSEGKATLIRQTTDPYVYAVSGGVETARVPTMQVQNKKYTLEGQTVRLTLTDGTPVKDWKMDQARECNFGVVYDQVMLVCKDGFFQRFDLELNAVGSLS
ncbi:hypothetical protein [Deinococcus cellulosilyticus]|uniref:Lipoprotein n=1 Tax=Deinococcus cellulosilyticus (strain DSM 18568 / NBRC 106333 / KACC 11606 / 5516J-15) TaxID=1223518 RepID=A0A511MXU0_DEIC1|nr:hypothetical protein [Deinococcus cellulosilyticus]GEM45108.1 hypothetical protein DC3_07430 [Deinococcus cellulosilyticus NBRC 106333 = KACC 11606]